MELFAGLIAGLIGLKLLIQLLLEHLNRKEARHHAGPVPEAFKDAMDEATYAKATEYTLAKGNFSRWELIVETGLLLLVLFSGVLPWAYSIWVTLFGFSAWALAGY